MFNKLVTRLQWFAKPEHQLIPGIIFVAIALFLLSGALQHFKALEKAPAVFSAQPADAQLIPVNVSLNIQHFPEFNIAQDSLTFEGNIWFSFDSSKVTEKEIENFSFALGQTLIKEKIAEAKDGNKTTIGYAIKVSLTSNFNYRLFPLDDHKMFIMLVNHHLKNKKIKYVCEQFLINADVTIQDWRIQSKQCTGGQIVTNIQVLDKPIEFPGVLFEVDIMRYGYREILLILLPIFAMFFLSMVLFPFSEADPGIIQVTASIIAAFIAYRFTVEPLIPKVGYITFADYVFLFFFNLSIFVFYFSCFRAPWLDKYRGVLLMLMYLLTTLWLYHILFMW